ncbi:hypothetical protein M9H77_13800 [Catharanthus roseus]|uniref:Uncharacterized protein n=1 Tax=Catharanthus roseus TaxID=4058 RepID=A0ACC0BLG5_CATRO|nr:hypothetical protein M9H77_13800 [Catharanthus roseus]
MEYGSIKILNDEMKFDVINIGNLVRNKEQFVKRRQLLVGPNSANLKVHSNYDPLRFDKPGKYNSDASNRDGNDDYVAALALFVKEKAKEFGKRKSVKKIDCQGGKI